MLGGIWGCSGGFGFAPEGCRDALGDSGDALRGGRMLKAGAGRRGGPGRRGGSPAAAARRGGAMESGGALNGSAAAGRFAAAGTAALAALMALLIAVTVAGNALVMLAFVADSSLRTQNNFFLLNLAISDFLVGKVPSLRGAPRPPSRCPPGPSRQQLRDGERRRGCLLPGCSGSPHRHPRDFLRRCVAPAPRHPPASPRSSPDTPGCFLRARAGEGPCPGGGHRASSRVPMETAPSGCRCLLHSAVRALCADGKVDLREKPLQTLAGS